MFSNLMNEVEAIRNAWGYNILEAIMWIREHEDEFPFEVRSELNEFMRQGQRMIGA